MAIVERKTFIKSGREILVTALDSGRTSRGQLVEVDAERARLVLPHTLPFGSSVQLDADEATIVGSVIAGVTGPQNSMVAVKVTRVVPSMSSLARLVSAVIRATPRKTIAAAAGAADRTHSEQKASEI